jgi:hypothetical protein
MQPNCGAGLFPAPLAAHARSRLTDGVTPPRSNRNDRLTRASQQRFTPLAQYT